MTVSDANKRLMLQDSGLIDLLVDGLILGGDDPRQGQPKVELLQETSASVLPELALFGPAASALRANGKVLDVLRQLVEVGTTKECRQCAAAALFELGEEARSRERSEEGTGQVGSAKPPPHIMMSYIRTSSSASWRGSSHTATSCGWTRSR